MLTKCLNSKPFRTKTTGNIALTKLNLKYNDPLWPGKLKTNAIIEKYTETHLYKIQVKYHGYDTIAYSYVWV